MGLTDFQKYFTHRQITIYKLASSCGQTRKISSPLLLHNRIHRNPVVSVVTAFQHFGYNQRTVVINR